MTNALSVMQLNINGLTELRVFSGKGGRWGMLIVETYSAIFCNAVSSSLYVCFVHMARELTSYMFI